MQPLANEHAVRAEVNMFPSRENFADEASEVRIDHRLASADGHDRRTAFVEGLQALLYGQFFADRIRIFANASASRARQIARVQGFEHHHERKLVGAPQALAGDVCGHAGRQTNWKSQCVLPSLCWFHHLAVSGQCK
jgi:hypothetical protein